MIPLFGRDLMKSSRVSAATFVNFEESSLIFFASSKLPISTIDSNVLIHVSNCGFEDPFSGEAPENGDNLKKKHSLIILL